MSPPYRWLTLFATESQIKESDEGPATANNSTNCSSSNSKKLKLTGFSGRKYSVHSENQCFNCFNYHHINFIFELAATCVLSRVYYAPFLRANMNYVRVHAIWRWSAACVYLLVHFIPFFSSSFIINLFHLFECLCLRKRIMKTPHFVHCLFCVKRISSQHLSIRCSVYSFEQWVIFSEHIRNKPRKESIHTRNGNVCWVFYAFLSKRWIEFTISNCIKLEAEIKWAITICMKLVTNQRSTANTKPRTTESDGSRKSNKNAINQRLLMSLNSQLLFEWNTSNSLEIKINNFVLFSFAAAFQSPAHSEL